MILLGRMMHNFDVLICPLDKNVLFKHSYDVKRGIISDDLRTMGDLRPSPGEINKLEISLFCDVSTPLFTFFITKNLYFDGLIKNSLKA